MTPTDTEARLRADLAAIAAHIQLTDRWDGLASEIDGGPAVVRPDFTAPRRHPVRVVAMAAAVAMLLAAGALATARSSTDDARRGATAGSIDPGPPRTAPDDGGGWVAPTHLPPGWSVESIDSESQDIEPGWKPLRAFRFTRLDPDADIGDLLVTIDPLAPLDEHHSFDQRVTGDPRRPSTERPTIGGEPARLTTTADDVSEVWFNGASTQTAIAAQGIDRQVLLDFAQRWKVDGARAELPPGYGADPVYTDDAPSARSITAVSVVLRNDTTGHRFAYVIHPYGYGSALDIRKRTVAQLGPMGATVMVFPKLEGTDVITRLVQLGRTDVSYGGQDESGGVTTTADDAELDAVTEHLEPVDAATWSSFVDSAEDVPGGASAREALKVSGIDDPTLVRR